MNQSSIHCFITCRWAVIPVQCWACAGTLEASDAGVWIRLDSSLWSWGQRTAAALFFWENLVIFHFRPHCPSPTSFFLSDPFVKTVNVTHAVHCNHKQYVITLNIQHTPVSAYCNIAASKVKHVTFIKTIKSTTFGFPRCSENIFFLL